jgi:hypothetical protein
MIKLGHLAKFMMVAAMVEDIATPFRLAPAPVASERIFSSLPMMVILAMRSRAQMAAASTVRTSSPSGRTMC